MVKSHLKFYRRYAMRWATINLLTRSGPLAKLQSHSDENVRLAVVHGLSCQDDSIAVSSLISLSADSNRDVRNWATFGLGSMTSVDSDALREALLERSKESDDEI